MKYGFPSMSSIMQLGGGRIVSAASSPGTLRALRQRQNLNPVPSFIFSGAPIIYKKKGT